MKMLELRNALRIKLEGNNEITFQTNNDNVHNAFWEYLTLNERMGIILSLECESLDLISNATGQVIDWNMKKDGEWIR